MKKILLLFSFGVIVLSVYSNCLAANGDVFIQRSTSLPIFGETFTTTVTIDSSTVPLGGYTIDIIYDSSFFNITSIEGASGFTAIPVMNSTTFASGQTRVTGTQGANFNIPDGQIEVMVITFTTIGDPKDIHQ